MKHGTVVRLSHAKLKQGKRRGKVRSRIGTLCLSVPAWPESWAHRWVGRRPASTPARCRYDTASGARGKGLHSRKSKGAGWTHWFTQTNTSSRADKPEENRERQTETEPKSRWPNSSRGSGSTCKEKGVANSAVIRLDRSRKPGQRIRQEDRGEPQDAYQEGTSNETYGPHGNSTDDQAARLREGREPMTEGNPENP